MSESIWEDKIRRGPSEHEIELALFDAWPRGIFAELRRSVIFHLSSMELPPGYGDFYANIDGVDRGNGMFRWTIRGRGQFGIWDMGGAKPFHATYDASTKEGVISVEGLPPYLLEKVEGGGSRQVPTQ